MPDPSCLRVVDVADRWSRSAGEVRALINAGQLPALSLGGIADYHTVLRRKAKR